MTSKKNKKGCAKPRFKVGDRVTEKDRFNNIWLSESGKESFKVFNADVSQLKFLSISAMGSFATDAR